MNKTADNLFYKRKNTTLQNEEFKLKAFEYCEGYKEFIDLAKTERECVSYARRSASENGYAPLDEDALCAGDKVYYVNREKSAFFAKIGTESIDSGINIIVSHVDSPRLDFKQIPLYEDRGLCYFKTHYYGGIKKYQWTATPLSLHGVIYKSNGQKVDICIGEDEDDPIFYISDLMPHIAKDQYDKKLGDAINGEGLNIITGSVPFDENEQAVKHNVLALLNEKYGITERDFITAEISATPSQKSRDVGFDRSMIAAYGHDDRICAFPAFTALMDSANVKKTAVVIFADKEEIGSVGITGMASECVKFFIKKLCEKTNGNYIKCIENSVCLSADVGGAFDPCYSEAYEEQNSALINNGIVVVKYTGSRGKS
ncbi:MAG: aminopeptidase, partial [Clostridia bacterium]